MSIPVVAIFDVGKTNKKLFLFDEHYNMIHERSARFTETEDEDGDPCENLESLRLSVFDSLREVFKKKEFDIKAINFSGYGASFVYIDEAGEPVAPLYNYLKEYPDSLKKQFYSKYGGEEDFSVATASPVLGSLNSGMQIYRIKYEKPELFERIKYALHLPQYLSYLISGVPCSDITSVGCHTNLWNFNQNTYHRWVTAENILPKMAPMFPSDGVLPASFPGNSYSVGVGLHDSSAALIPYLVNFNEPFILISTGTWCISLNPFNSSPLTKEELNMDCLCYMGYKGDPVKASRLFAGHEHEIQVKRIADHFTVNSQFYKAVDFDPQVISRLGQTQKVSSAPLTSSAFGERDLASFADEKEAYHQLMADIVAQQYISTQLVLKNSKVKRIFVDGGFSKNPLYMNLLALAFPEMEVYAASMAQATAIGTAVAIHKHWNSKALPGDIIELKYYSVARGAKV